MDIYSFNATQCCCSSFTEAIIIARKCTKSCPKKGVLDDFAATVFAMVALLDSLHGLVTPCSQAQEAKMRMMWQNCLTIPTINSHIFHNFGLLFLIWTSNGLRNYTSFIQKQHFFGHGFEYFAVIIIVSKNDGHQDYSIRLVHTFPDNPNS